MSAAVETMAYAGVVPWHGLGVPVNNDLTPDEMLVKAGLNWTVSKRPIFYPAIDAKLGSADLEASAKLLLPGDYALVRDSDNSFLDVVGSRYQPVQNADAFEFFDKFVKSNKLEMHTAGSLHMGRYIWALAKTRDSFALNDNDVTESYVLLMSPHVLGKSLIAMQTSVRVVCQNTLNLALSGGQIAYKMSHSRTFNDSEKGQAAIALGLITTAFEEYGEAAQFLSSRACDVIQARDFFRVVMKIKDKDIANDEDTKENRLVRRMMVAFDGDAPGQDLDTTKGTWWGALNAVTYVMDHQAGNKKKPDNNLRDNWLGYRGNTKRLALDLAIKEAEAA